MLYDRKNDSTRILVESGFYDSDPRFSGDGARVVFVRASRLRREHMGFGQIWGSWDVYILVLKSGLTFQLSNRQEYGIISPQFRDDRHVLWGVVGGSDEGIFEGSQAQKVPEKLSAMIPWAARFFGDDEMAVLQSPYVWGGNKHRIAWFKHGRLSSVLYESTHNVDSFDVSSDTTKGLVVMTFGEDRFLAESRLYLVDFKSGASKEVVPHIGIFDF